MVAYADDSSIYFAGDSKENVRKVLQDAAEEVLTFFRATSLSANESKTKFMMFGSQKERPISIGQTQIEESASEELLRFTYNKALSWKDHLSKLESELQKRIGILRRLSWHLPQKIVVGMVEPIFTSKLRYGIALVCNCFSVEDTSIKKLHSLHRIAMKASLKLANKHHPSDTELLRKTGQKSVMEMTRIATANMAWKAGQNWNVCPLTADRLDKHIGERTTRQSVQRTLPPQGLNTCDSLIPRLVEMWELLPEEIRNEKDNT